MKNKILIFFIIILILIIAGLVDFNFFFKSKETPLEKPEELMTVQVFFSNTQKDPGLMDCSKVYPVERKILKTKAVVQAALEELLTGPTNIEKEAGYLTSINPGVKIQKIIIQGETAKVDFDKQLEYQVGGSCRVAAIRAQITKTLKQFPTVKEAIISIDGRTEDILQP